MYKRQSPDQVLYRQELVRTYSEPSQDLVAMIYGEEREISVGEGKRKTDRIQLYLGLFFFL